MNPLTIRLKLEAVWFVHRPVQDGATYNSLRRVSQNPKLGGEDASWIPANTAHNWQHLLKNEG